MASEGVCTMHYRRFGAVTSQIANEATQTDALCEYSLCHLRTTTNLHNPRTMPSHDPEKPPRTEIDRKKRLKSPG